MCACERNLSLEGRLGEFLVFSSTAWKSFDSILLILKRLLWGLLGFTIMIAVEKISKQLMMMCGPRNGLNMSFSVMGWLVAEKVLSDVENQELR